MKKKTVEGFPNYEVYEDGSIWSNKMKLFLKPHACKRAGYLRVNLMNNGKRFSKTVHRLVAEAFIANNENLPCINHKDEDKSNNHYTNLEWCTHAYNNSYGTMRERKVQNTNYKAVGLKNSKEVYQRDLNGNLIQIWDSANACKRVTGFDNSVIAKCCRGVMKKAYGCTWRYG